MIRRATADDVPTIVAMGAQFIAAEYPAAIRFDAIALTALVTSLIDGAGVVFVADGADGVCGMLGLTTYVQPMSGDRIASELAWWVNPAQRGGRAALRLLAVAERWARDQQATALQMIAPSDHVAQFYERVGFVKVETHYQRAL